MLAWLAARSWLFTFGFLILAAVALDALGVTNGWVTLGGLVLSICLGWFVGGIVTGLVHELQAQEYKGVVMEDCYTVPERERPLEPEERELFEI